MIQDILIPFLAIGLAELGDKTQLAVLCLSSQTKKHLKLFLGIMLAFLIADGLAILFGDFIKKFIPSTIIKIVAAIIFIIFGIIFLINHKKEEAKCELKKPFLSGFSIILFSELGDKTQIASALFATEFNSFFVLLGVMLALALLSIAAIYTGKLLMKKLNRRLISIISGILFIIIGFIILFF